MSSASDQRFISPVKARRKSQAPSREKTASEKKKTPELESGKVSTARPRLLDAEYQRLRLSGSAQLEKSGVPRPQYGAIGFGVDAQARYTARLRSNSGSSLGASKEGKRMKKNPLGGLFTKPPKLDKKEEDKAAGGLDKRQKEQKKKLEAELAKREQEKQKKDKEILQILLTYLDEQLAQGTQSRMRTPLGAPRFEAAPPLIPRVFAEIAKQ